MKLALRLILTLSCLLATETLLRAQTAKHVFVFGVDGLSPRGINDNPTPAVHQLMKDGIWTLHARSVIPTVSSPNWATMIMGAAPDLTGVTSNDWQPNKFDIVPACQDAPGIYPTIFSAIQKKGIGATGLFTDWPDFARLAEPGAITKVMKQDGHADQILSAALDFWKGQKPALLFLHLDFVDDAGHEHNWYGPEYNRAVNRMDDYLRQVRAAIEKSELANDSILLLTADHGGHDKKHGSMSMTDVEIPWIAAGAGLRANYELPPPVSTTQTTPTIATWLGVPLDPCWMARPIGVEATGTGR